MSLPKATSDTVEIRIMDKDYLVACPSETRHELLDAARHLDSKMRDIRNAGKVFGSERIAVMAALNITHEMLFKKGLSPAASELLATMGAKLDEALD